MKHCVNLWNELHYLQAPLFLKATQHTTFVNDFLVQLVSFHGRIDEFNPVYFRNIHHVSLALRTSRQLCQPQGLEHRKIHLQILLVDLPDQCDTFILDEHHNRTVRTASERVERSSA
eukprot:SAG22_NODE_670_length_7987_cov_2.733519_2_plen_117_part_00